MKLRPGFKLVLYVSLSLLYFSGAYVWARGMAPDASRLTVSLLHFHSIISLWFLILFGYLWHSHIQKGLKARKKMKSGISLPLGSALLGHKKGEKVKVATPKGTVEYLIVIIK